MRYRITGQQIDVGAALQTHVREEVGAILEKYSARPTDANVIFSREGHAFATEIVVHLSTGLTLQARNEANEIYNAFDGALAKAEKQLRRYKRRLKDHQRERSEPVELSGGSAYILARSDDGDDEEPDTLQPMIIAEMETSIPSLTVGEAVMQMELAGVPVLVFRNDKQNSGLNVVYRREDGNIGWIEPD